MRCDTRRAYPLPARRCHIARMTQRSRTAKEDLVRTPRGEGAGSNRKTTIKLLRPDQVWQPALGAPRGNRNAAKPLSTLEARVRDLRRRARIAIKAADL